MQTPWRDGDRKIAAVQTQYQALATGDPATSASEDAIFALLFEVVRHKKHHASYMPAVEPVVAELLADPEHLTTVFQQHDPDFPMFSDADIIDVRELVAELEALHRWAMVLHNLYPWHRSNQRLAHPGDIKDDDFVIVFEPRNRDVANFLNLVRDAQRQPSPAAPPPTKAVIEPVQLRTPTRR